jgi:hypothetical protein
MQSLHLGYFGHQRPALVADPHGDHREDDVIQTAFTITVVLNVLGQFGSLANGASHLRFSMM